MIEQRDRDVVPDRPMRADLVIVSAPILHLFGRVGKRQEPVRVQAFCPEAPVEGFDVGVVRRLSRPGEVERDAFGVGPQVEVSGDELAAMAVRR